METKKRIFCMSLISEKAALSLGKLDLAWQMAGPENRKIIYGHHLLDEGTAICGHAGFATHPDTIEGNMTGLVDGLGNEDDPRALAHSRSSLGEAYVRARLRRNWSQRPVREADFPALAETLSDMAVRRGIISTARLGEGYNEDAWHERFDAVKAGGHDLGSIIDIWNGASPEYPHPIAEILWMTALPFLLETGGFGQAAALPFAICLDFMSYIEGDERKRFDLAMVAVKNAADKGFASINKWCSHRAKFDSLLRGHRDAARAHALLHVLGRRRITAGQLAKMLDCTAKTARSYLREFCEIDLVSLETTPRPGLGGVYRVHGVGA